MANKTEQTASFMVRFNQRIFEEDGESKVQWRGRISHVQDGDEKRFSDVKDALVFMQEKLANLTSEATKDQSSEEQDSILQKSLSMWKTMKTVAPQMIKETIKDPKKQISNIQDQLQDQISTLGEEIGEKVQIDQWRNASRSDFKKVQDSLSQLTREIKRLNSKVEALSKK